MEIVTVEVFRNLIADYGFPISLVVVLLFAFWIYIGRMDKKQEARENRIIADSKERETMLLENFDIRDKRSQKREDNLIREMNKITDISNKTNETNKSLSDTNKHLAETVNELVGGLNNEIQYVKSDVVNINEKVDKLIDFVVK